MPTNWYVIFIYKFVLLKHATVLQPCSKLLAASIFLRASDNGLHSEILRDSMSQFELILKFGMPRIIHSHIQDDGLMDTP